MTEVLVIINLVNTYIVFSFMNMMYEKRYNSKSVYIAAFIGYCVLHIFVNMQRIYVLNILFAIFIIQVLGRYFYKDLQQKVVYNLLFALYLIFMDAVAFAIISLILSQPLLNMMFSQYLVGLSCAFQYSTVLFTYKPLVRRFLQTNQTENNPKWQNMFFVMVAMLQIGVISYLWAKESETAVIFLLLNSAGFISVDMYLVYLFAIVRRHEQKRYELGLYKQQSLLLNQHIKEMQKMNKETRQMIHDIRAHQMVIEGLIYRGEMESAMLLQTQLKDAMEEIEAPLHCHHPIMNAMINNCQAMAEEMNIETQFIVEAKIDWRFMKELHMTALFSNLLNNALEACQQMAPEEKRFIECRVGQKGESILVNVRNTYHKELLRVKDGKYLSTKKEHLGIGLSNIKHIVDLYEGSCHINEGNRLFCVSIYLTISATGEEEEILYDCSRV